MTLVLDPRHLERFKREARAAARLHHTNIVPVHGVGQEALTEMIPSASSWGESTRSAGSVFCSPAIGKGPKRWT